MTNPSPESDAADREIVISRVLHAPRELVWRAWVDPEQVAKWWGPRGFTTSIKKMDLRVGGVWHHVMHGPDGRDYPNKSTFQEIVPLEKIVFRHGGGPADGKGATFQATWTFEDAGEGKTRLTGRMVFPTKEARDFVVREFGAVEGGKQTLERAAEHLAGVVAKAFVIRRELDTPRELVWQAWTQREHLMAWFGPTGFTMPEARLDLRPGGTFHYRLLGPNGIALWGRSVYREVVPPARLVWINSFSDAAGGITRHPLTKDLWPLEMLTAATFEDLGGRTAVTITMLPFDAPGEERDVFERHRGSMQSGWGGTLDRLEGFLVDRKDGR